METLQIIGATMMGIGVAQIINLMAIYAVFKIDMDFRSKSGITHDIYQKVTGIFGGSSSK